MSLPRAEVLRDLEPDLRRLIDGCHHDPHSLLGAHRRGDALVVIALLPHADQVMLQSQARGEPWLDMTRLPLSDVFFWCGNAAAISAHQRLRWRDPTGATRERFDAYSFAPLIDAAALQRFGDGHDATSWQQLGAHARSVDGIDGVQFAVWAPNAERVSVVGQFCQWDGRCFAMRSRGASGIWELFIPGLSGGEIYKFEIRSRARGEIFLKSDPYAAASELRPATASRVAPRSTHVWHDANWLQQRRIANPLRAPVSIYEAHLGSWRRGPHGEFLNYRKLAAELVPYLQRLGFTYVELLPITEHPLDDSWGYQTTGYFAPTSRHGSPDDLKFLIDACHQAGIGVLLDWVPAHFPRDAHGLANFDGSALYEYPDPQRAEHKDWGTLIFNYERKEVRSFLLSSACYWIEEFHFDGLRVDAVASMIYLDFSLRRDNFVPNKHGGNTNLEAIDFLRELNHAVLGRNPGTLMIAEESTDWPLVTRPPHDGGLGFSMKWDMGWMHDNLAYFKLDPIYRQDHHEKLTFAQMYAYSENFVLPLSHDEVVHLKSPLVYKMPGDRWQQFANLRLLFTSMWTSPGKKLLFMGGEFAQTSEWDFRAALPWHLTQHGEHAGMQALIADLNRLYREHPALHELDHERAGFQWIDCNDRARSWLAFVRYAAQPVAVNGPQSAAAARSAATPDCLVIALNFTPVPRQRLRIGVPQPGRYRELLNSDSNLYGGSNLGNLASVNSTDTPALGFPYSIEITLPPLAGLILQPTLSSTR